MAKENKQDSIGMSQEEKDALEPEVIGLQRRMKEKYGENVARTGWLIFSATQVAHGMLATDSRMLEPFVVFGDNALSLVTKLIGDTAMDEAEKASVEVLAFISTLEERVYENRKVAKRAAEEALKKMNEGSK